MPGVARRLLTFLASPRKVSKRRRPEVHRPAKARGSLRYSTQQAAAELGLEVVSREMIRSRSPSNSPRGKPLSRLRYSATLIGTPPHSNTASAANNFMSYAEPGANLISRKNILSPFVTASVLPQVCANYINPGPARLSSHFHAKRQAGSPVSFCLHARSTRVRMPSCMNWLQSTYRHAQACEIAHPRKKSICRKRKIQ